LVKAANWLNHLEFDWESPVWKHFFTALAGTHQLIRYDARGNGLSSWDVDDFGLDRQVEDLKAVVDTLGLETFPLLGLSQGCAKAVVFAARYPERVTRMVLCGGYARGWRHRDPADSASVGEARCTLIRSGWGSDNKAIRQMLTTIYMPDAPAEAQTWFTDLQRKTATAENAAAILLAHGDVDIRGILGNVRAPTLVIHARNDVVVPYDQGQELAAGIEGARFVTLDTANHILPATDPAWQRCMCHIHDFLEA
jgi:pimeloyl-ACP methyl ester carboxylesterase